MKSRRLRHQRKAEAKPKKKSEFGDEDEISRVSVHTKSSKKATPLRRINLSSTGVVTASQDLSKKKERERSRLKRPTPLHDSDALIATL